jgi:hypothetical protein
MALAAVEKFKIQSRVGTFSHGYSLRVPAVSYRINSDVLTSKGEGKGITQEKRDVQKSF